MTLKLVNISVSLGGNTLNLTQLLPEVENDLLNFGKDGANLIAKYALSSFKSAVPVFSKQLRNQHIQADFAKSNQKVMQSSVYVVDQPHTASPRSKGKTYVSSELARILDEGTNPESHGSMKRSQSSIAEFGFPSIPSRSPTKDWITDGYLNLLSKLDKEGII